MLTRRQFVKMCVCSILSTGCVDSFYQPAFHAEAAGTKEIPVLLYHRVGYTAGGLTISPERFENDLTQLVNSGYQAISLGQFENYLLNKRMDIPEKPVLITFDDGYLDNYENAYPILRRHSMTAAFFIITGMLRSNMDRMSPEHIKEMAEAGMSFGSHTVSHRLLAELTAEEVQAELAESKTALESMIGMTVDAIAYPGGSYNSNILKIVQTNGYIAGFTVANGTCSKSSRLLELRRIPVFGYDGDVLSVLAKRR